MRPEIGLLCITVAAPACGCPHDPGPLVDPDAWTLVGANEDPFEDRLSQIDCEAFAYGAEFFGGERAFSVDTGDCNYVTVTQPLLRGVCAGAQVKARLWHFELTGPPGEGHVAMAIDGATVWEERVSIPSDSELLVSRIDAGELAAGTPIHFHVHNHGSNSYSLLEVSVEDE